MFWYILVHHSPHVCTDIHSPDCDPLFILVERLRLSEYNPWVSVFGVISKLSRWSEVQPPHVIASLQLWPRVCQMTVKGITFDLRDIGKVLSFVTNRAIAKYITLVEGTALEDLVRNYPGVSFTVSFRSFFRTLSLALYFSLSL